ncbi:MAG: LysR family transcriptional regulator [Opitutae bacterium]|nr:LysR family transcriptional regulator [Opitutae bacterium]
MKRNRPLDTRQLMAFELLADTGSFTGAAKSLFLTQSAVSHSMRALEDDLGCALLRRHGKKVSLTDAGKYLLDAARPILRQMENTRSELEGFERYGSSRLRIGTSPKSCQFFLPSILRRFKEEHTRCRFEVEDGHTPECFRMLRAGEIDLAITLEPRKADEVEFLPWFSDEMRLVVAPDHPWAKTGWMNKKNIPQQNFILPNKKSYTFLLIMDYLKQEDVRLTSFLEMSNLEAIKELIKVGCGISFLASWTVSKEVDTGDLVMVRPARRKLSRTFGVSFPKGRGLSQTELAFARIGEQVGCEWMVNRKI